MTVGATSALDVVMTSGVDEGAVVARNIRHPRRVATSEQPSQDGHRQPATRQQ